MKKNYAGGQNSAHNKWKSRKKRQRKLLTFFEAESQRICKRAKERRRERESAFCTVQKWKKVR